MIDLLLLSLGQLALLTVLAAASWTCGTAAACLLDRENASWPAGLRAALGLTLLAQVFWWLGILRWLNPLTVAAVAAGALALAFWRWPLFPAQLKAVSRWKFGLLVVGALPIFVLTLYPPIGYDQTLYHLPFVHAFAAAGGLVFLPDLRFPVFPQLVEILQTALFSFGGDVGTQIGGFFALGVLIVLLFAWSAEKAGQEAGWLASAVLIGSPCVVYISTCGYLEPFVALFVFSALLSVERCLSTGRNSWAVVAGLFAGTAAAAKYFGLFFIAAAALALISRDRRLCFERWLMFGIAVVVTASPTYVRNFYYTGNPLFPFFLKLFGPNPWGDAPEIAEQGFARLLAASTLLFDLTFRREGIGLLPPYSMFFTFAGPLALIALWRWPSWRLHAGVALAFLALAPVHAHYFLTIAAFWALVFAAGLARLIGESRRHWLTALAVVAALAGGPVYALYRIALLGPPPTESSARATWLGQQFPEYRAIDFLERVAPGGRVFAAGIDAARLSGYYSGTLLGDFNGPENVRHIEAESRRRGSLAPILRELEADWLLIYQDETFWLLRADGDTGLEPAFEDGAAKVYRVLKES